MSDHQKILREKQEREKESYWSGVNISTYTNICYARSANSAAIVMDVINYISVGVGDGGGEWGGRCRKLFTFAFFTIKMTEMIKHIVYQQ